MPRIKLENRYSILRSIWDVPDNKVPEEYIRFGNPLELFPFLRTEASKVKKSLDDLMDKIHSETPGETK